MARLSLTLSLALLGAACVGREPLLLPPGHATAATQPVSPRARPAEPAEPVEPLPLGKDGTIFGAKFEPPKGRILHGMGQFKDGNKAYLAMLGDAPIQPASYLDFRAIGDWPRNWDARLQLWRKELAAEEKLGRIPQVDLAFYGIDPASGGRVSVDLEVANSDRYDERIQQLAQVLASFKGPVFLRIGGEFSGEWMGYHAFDYPRAYRKVVEMFRAEGADNVAFVWCYESSAPDDFDHKDSRGWKWFPGDDIIDWYGIDLFSPAQFTPQPGKRSAEKLANTKRFLAMARKHRKPVMIGECSPSQEGITADAVDGQRDWENWFVPFLELLDQHPEIEAFYLINYDWTKSADSAANGWLPAELQVNPYLSEKWMQELRKPRYLHLDDVALLKDYDAARNERPPYKGPGPADPDDYEPPKRGGR